MELRSLALNIVLDELRREDRFIFPQRYARASMRRERLAPGLSVDEEARVVFLHV